ncbi:MAG TPA: HD domain-containing protein [Candidatus Tumulicola sp.]
MISEPLSPRFEKALVYAAHVHRTQVRKKTAIPYVSHLLAVAAIVLENDGDEDEAIAALLHDAAEDRGGRSRLDDIRERFGQRVADIVEACSDSLEEQPERKAEWKTRKQDYHRHLRETLDRSVYLVSAADKLHNARATLEDLVTHGDGVWDRFEAERGDTIWNYDELLGIYRAGPPDERRAPIVRQLEAVVERLRER